MDALRARLIVALVLAIVAVTAIALSLPDYMRSLQMVLADPQAVPPSPSPLLLVASWAGLGALVIVAIEQLRRRQIGWFVMSLLFSYPAIGVYAVRGVMRGLPALSRREPA